MTETCRLFTEAVEDLSLGLSEAGDADRLLAHARGCAACQQLLDRTAAVADALLELAPQVEPPAGFEGRAVASIVRPQQGAARRRRWSRPGLTVAAAAGVVAVALVGAAAGRWTAGPVGARSGAVLTADGARYGEVELTGDGDRARLVLTTVGPSNWPGIWTCELEDEGRWVAVGSWRADEVNAGVWATGVARDLADASRMRILDGRGREIARADLD